MKPSGDFGLYVVMTSPRNTSYEKLTEACVACKVKMLQLRDKELCDKERLALAKRLVAITSNSDTRFIVNDRIDIALASGAAGFHLGQDDLPLAAVRPYAGNLLAGLSSHTPQQAASALAQNPDYLAFGPVFPTPAKNGRDAVTGTAVLGQILNKCTIPLVAIGGIDCTNIGRVLEQGLRNIALIRAVDTAQPVDAIRKLQTIIGEQYDIN